MAPKKRKCESEKMALVPAAGSVQTLTEFVALPPRKKAVERLDQGGRNSEVMDSEHNLYPDGPRKAYGMIPGENGLTKMTTRYNEIQDAIDNTLSSQVEINTQVEGIQAKIKHNISTVKSMQADLPTMRESLITATKEYNQQVEVTKKTRAGSSENVTEATKQKELKTKCDSVEKTIEKATESIKKIQEEDIPTLNEKVVNLKSQIDEKKETITSLQTERDILFNTAASLFLASATKTADEGLSKADKTCQEAIRVALEQRAKDIERAMERVDRVIDKIPEARNCTKIDLLSLSKGIMPKKNG